MASLSDIRVKEKISCQKYIVWLSMMSGHSPNPIFFDKKDWTLRTFAAPPNPSTSDKDLFLSHPNPTPIHTHTPHPHPHTHPTPIHTHTPHPHPTALPTHQAGCHMCIVPNLFPCRLGYISQK